MVTGPEILLGFVKNLNKYPPSRLILDERNNCTPVEALSKSTGLHANSSVMLYNVVGVKDYRISSTLVMK